MPPWPSNFSTLYFPETIFPMYGSAAAPTVATAPQNGQKREVSANSLWHSEQTLMLGILHGPGALLSPAALTTPGAAGLNGRAMAKTVKCSRCGRENDAAFAFCLDCGQPLRAATQSGAAAAPQQYCEACGKPLDPGFRFCGHCGKPVAAAAPAEGKAAAPAEPAAPP